MGVSHPRGRWTLDLSGGVWLFTSNDQFYLGESTRTQDPLLVLQTHVSDNVTRRAWAAVGATLALPVGSRQSLEFAYSTGASTRTGADFDTVAVARQILWFDRPRPRQP